MQSLADIFAQEEARLSAEALAEAQAEQAAWDALSDDERAAIIEARADKIEAMFDIAEADDDEGADDED